MMFSLNKTLDCVTHEARRTCHLKVRLLSYSFILRVIVRIFFDDSIIVRLNNIAILFRSIRLVDRSKLVVFSKEQR